MIEAVYRTKSLLAVVLLAFALGGCASVPANPEDPLERYNRAMFAVNDGLDRAVLRPTAKAYEAVTPRLVRTGVGNFFGNIEDIWIGFNNILQGKVGDGMSDWMRFMVNSTFGVAGLFDIASEMGLQKNDEDFGQTLAVWGVGEGPHVVLPFFGSRTLRDAFALPVDMRADLASSIEHVPTRNSVRALRIVNTRASLLGFDSTLDEAIDRYAFVRDFYLQQRRYKVSDGNVPLEYEDFDAQNGVSSLPVRSHTDALVEVAVESLELVSLVESDRRADAFVIR